MTAAAIFIPGNMCDARLWTGAVRDSFARRGSPVIDADTSRDDTISGMAERALSLVPGPLVLIGFSMGAIVALAMAGAARDRLAACVLIGLNAGPDLPERSAVRLRQQGEVRAGGLERVLIEELKPNYLAARNRKDRKLLGLLRDMGLALGPDVFVAQSEALRTRPDHRPVLDSLDVPVLLACGAEDALCPPAWHADWAARLKRPTFRVVEGAGHMLPLEADAWLAAGIDSWLTETLP